MRSLNLWYVSSSLIPFASLLTCTVSQDIVRDLSLDNDSDFVGSVLKYEHFSCFRELVLHIMEACTSADAKKEARAYLELNTADDRRRFVGYGMPS